MNLLPCDILLILCTELIWLNFASVFSLLTMKWETTLSSQPEGLLEQGHWGGPSTGGPGCCPHHSYGLSRILLAALFSPLPTEVSAPLRINRKRQDHEFNNEQCVGRKKAKGLPRCTLRPRTASAPRISQGSLPLPLISHHSSLFLQHARVTPATGPLHHFSPR